MRKALCDVEPSVMGASLNLYLEAIKEDPNKYKEHAGSFVLILKQIIEHKLPKDFDYSRIPAPWI
jgi:AP-4 complex subunit epsilon-1